MLDKNFRLFGKFALMDILLAAMIVGVVYVGIQFSAPLYVEASPTDTRIIYTVELTNKREDFIENVRLGAPLFDSVRGFEIGTIVGVRYTPFFADATDFDAGIVRRAEAEGFVFIYIDVETTAQVSERATSVGLFDVMVGMEVFVRTRDFASAGFVVQLQHLDQ